MVRTTSGVSLDERIVELSKVAKFAGSMPAAKPIVAASDMASMSQNIDKIARGEITVKD